MKRATWITLAICAATLGIATAAIAYQHERGPGGMVARMKFDRIAVRLKLTPQQETQIKADLAQARQGAKPDIDSMRQLRAGLAKQIFIDQPNQAAIQQNAAQLKQQISAMIDQYVSAGVRINSVLTPEQRAEVQKMIVEHQQLAERRQARMQQFRERWNKQPQGTPDQQRQ